MQATLVINVILRSGKVVSFSGITPGKACNAIQDGVRIKIGAALPASAVTITPPNRTEPVASVEYQLTTPIRNYHKVIVPESGRWYIINTMMVSLWRYKNESAVNDVKQPLFIFTGQDLNTALAFGVVGRCYETSFRTLEPRTNRALIAYMRRLTIQIKRGTEMYPIPDSVALANDDGSITEHLYFATDRTRRRQPWLMTLRDFSNLQKRLFGISDVTSPGSLEPLWCSWTDWFSNDVTDEVILRSVEQGLKLGITNYIIDDGWFGPGLDNDYDVELNIGDWDADPAKIKDMGELVRKIKALGARPMIWCAPHAVAPGAKCFEDRKKYLIIGADGKLVMTPNKFHSLCFMSPQARQIMADICTSFITRWDFDGAKYDLYNCLPITPCTNTGHSHDCTSMIEGLEKTFELIDTSCRALKKDYIVELKQNYATPFLARWGTMTRAGDTPYNTEGNFLRTIYVQAYTPYAINDYQTITPEDSPASAGCIVLKMMAAGIPAYSIDFERLNDANKRVIAHYNRWYLDNLKMFKKHRVPKDGENNVLMIPGREKSFVFLVNDGLNAELPSPATILNATYNTEIFVRIKGNPSARITTFDCFGRKTGAKKTRFKGWHVVPAEPGGMITIDF